MIVHLPGRLTFSNGSPAVGVQVLAFDRDAPGQQDDDLTITPGMTNSNGIFTVIYDSSRCQDMNRVIIRVPKDPPFDWTLEDRVQMVPVANDTCQIYLHFNYSINNQVRQSQQELRSPGSVYQLPETRPLNFIPSIHGFHFSNRFSGPFLPFSLPAIPGLTNPNDIYGLCGGMSAGALDFCVANRKIPSVHEPPANGEPLQKYLYHRQLESFGNFAWVIFRFVEWMGLPDDTLQGTQKRTYDEFLNIRAQLNRGTPAVLGMQYVKWPDSTQVWDNHQVLAIGYTLDVDGIYHIQLYDPNFKDNDSVTIEARKVQLGVTGNPPVPVYGFQCLQKIGSSQTHRLYGFFSIPYRPVIPPEELP